MVTLSLSWPTYRGSVVFPSYTLIYRRGAQIDETECNMLGALMDRLHLTNNLALIVVSGSIYLILLEGNNRIDIMTLYDTVFLRTMPC